MSIGSALAYSSLSLDKVCIAVSDTKTALARVSESPTLPTAFLKAQAFVIKSFPM